MFPKLDIVKLKEYSIFRKYECCFTFALLVPTNFFMV